MKKLLVTFLMFCSFVVYAGSASDSQDAVLANNPYSPSALSPLVDTWYSMSTGLWRGLIDPNSPLSNLSGNNGYSSGKTWAVGEPIDMNKMTASFSITSCGLDFDCQVKSIKQGMHDVLVQLFAWFIELFLYFTFIAFEASYKFSINIIEQYNIVANMQEAFSQIPSRYVAILVYIAIPQLFSACITAVITVFMFRRVFSRF